MDRATEALSYFLFPTAPTLAVALRGPFADEARRLLASIATPTTPQANASQILEALQNQDVDPLEKLLNAETYWKASHPPMALCDPCVLATRHDTTVRNLAYLVTAGFFLLIAMLAYASTHQVIDNNPLRDVLMTMAGVVGTGWAAIISFFFGSSVGSRTQSTTLSSIATGHAQQGAPETNSQGRG